MFLVFGLLDIADRSTFSAIWVLDDLIETVGPVNCGASLKALSTWVYHGILIEDLGFTFNLLERGDLGGSDA